MRVVLYTTVLRYGYQPDVTFVFYHTRGTTTPIPANGDYKVLFAKQVPANTQRVDCSDVMPRVGCTDSCTPVTPTGLGTRFSSPQPRYLPGTRRPHLRGCVP
jgi:hypothetical protein